MSHPVCASNCIELAIEEDPCHSQQDISTQLKCLCMSQSYLASSLSCINLYCDAADISAWKAYGESNCAAVGVTFSTTSAVTATSAPGPPSTSVTFQTSVVTAVGFPDATTTGSSTSTSGTQPASASTTQNSKNGLGVGAIAGITVGAAVVLLLAALVAVLLWRRKIAQTCAPPPESGPVREVGPSSSGPDAWSDPKSTMIPGVVFKPELHAEEATRATNCKKQLSLRKSSDEVQYPLKQPAPTPHNLVHQISPPSVKSEIVGVVPSEVDASTVAPSEYGPSYHHGYVEADSMSQSQIPSPMYELGNDSYRSQYELSTTPQSTWYPAEAGVSGLTQRELLSSPAVQPTFPVIEPDLATATGERVAEHVDGNAEDAELDRMKSEIETIRVEREHILHLQALEERERELSRKITNRELSRTTGSRILGSAMFV